MSSKICRLDRGGASVAVLTLAALSSLGAFAQEALPEIEVAAEGDGRGAASTAAQTTREKPFSKAVPDNIPAVVHTVTAAKIAETVNATTAIEMLRYAPSLDMSAKFPGDRYQSLTGRTIGPFEPQRQLVYKDGMLISALFGTSEHTPKYSMIVPEEVSRIDVMYGPYSALYSGNSIGGVITYTTKMPEQFELHSNLQGILAPYDDQYATHRTNPGFTGGVSIGDRIGDFSWRASYNHLLTHSQPISYAVSSSPGGAAGTPVLGGFFDRDRQGALRGVFGTAGLQTTEENVGTLKIAYDFNKDARLSYSIGLMQLGLNIDPQSYLRDATTGLPIYNTTNGRISMNGLNFALSGLNPSHTDFLHLMQGAEFKTQTGGVFDMELVGSSYDLVRDVSVSALKYGVDTSGQTREYGGTGWKVMDMRFIFRPEEELLGKHELSFGGHLDEYTLKLYLQSTPTYWSSSYLQQAQRSSGKTENHAVYLQDLWKLAPNWTITLGGRQEWWRAFDGFNENALGTGTRQPERNLSAFMPKASLAFQATPELLLRGSYGNVTRFPGVTELYQRTVSPSGIVISSPDLKSEQADSYELAAEYLFGKHNAHLAFFHEDRWNGIVSQTNITVVPNVTNFSNVGKVRYNGVEGAIGLKDFLIDGFDVDANATYTTNEILSNPNNSRYVGKDVLQMPRWKVKWIATYHVTKDLVVSAGFRYKSASHGQLDNYDWNTETFGAYGRNVQLDLRGSWKFAPNWTAVAGVNNLNNYRNYLYAPYPQRTFFAELKYDFGADPLFRREEQYRP
jgi:iron complex outermembrane receptor protein